MTNYQQQTFNDPSHYHEQFHEVMEAAHQARAKAMRDGFTALVRATKHAFNA